MPQRGQRSTLRIYKVSLRNTSTPGVISDGESYTLREFSARTGLARYAIAQARKNGLPVIEIGKKRFVRGQDWHAFLAVRAGAAVTT